MNKMKASTGVLNCPDPFIGFRVKPQEYITLMRLAREQNVTTGIYVRDLVGEFLRQEFKPGDEPVTGEPK